MRLVRLVLSTMALLGAAGCSVLAPALHPAALCTDHCRATQIASGSRYELRGNRHAVMLQIKRDW
jgi:hypothetical protein